LEVGNVSTYNLAVQIVLLDHDGVDSLGVFEGEEAKSTRAAGSTVTHHGAFQHLTEFFKVVLERF
jgi:hypothetical protein